MSEHTSDTFLGLALLCILLLRFLLPSGHHHNNTQPECLSTSSDTFLGLALLALAIFLLPAPVVLLLHWACLLSHLCKQFEHIFQTHTVEKSHTFQTHTVEKGHIFQSTQWGKVEQKQPGSVTLQPLLAFAIFIESIPVFPSLDMKVVPVCNIVLAQTLTSI